MSLPDVRVRAPNVYCFEHVSGRSSLTFNDQMSDQPTLSWGTLKAISKFNPVRIGWFKASFMTVRTQTWSSLIQDLLLPTTINHTVPKLYNNSPIGAFAGLLGGFLIIVNTSISGIPSDLIDRIILVVGVIISAPIFFSVSWDLATLPVRLITLYSRIQHNKAQLQHPVIAAIRNLQTDNTFDPATTVGERLGLDTAESIFITNLDGARGLARRPYEFRKFDLIELPDSPWYADDVHCDSSDVHIRPVPVR